MLFLLSTVDLVQLAESFGLYPHLYANDTQIYGATANLLNRVAAFVTAVADWMRSNRLQLNASKTKVLWCACQRVAKVSYPLTCWVLALIDSRPSAASTISLFMSMLT